MAYGNKQLSASFTLEASLVMPIALLSIALLIRGGIELHNIVLGKTRENVSLEVESHMIDSEEWENDGSRPEVIMRKLTLVEEILE